MILTVLSFMACLRADEESCRKFELSSYNNQLTVTMCEIHHQQYLSAWSGMHPTWRITGEIKCERVDTEEDKNNKDI